MLQDETGPGTDPGSICKYRVACDELPGLSCSCRRGTRNAPIHPTSSLGCPKPLPASRGGRRLLSFGFGNSLPGDMGRGGSSYAS